MPRPEKPISTDAPLALRELAEHLRELRAQSGLTYSQLADRVEASPSNLSRAASGASLPSWSAVESFARATRAKSSELGPLKELWLRAAASQREDRVSYIKPGEELNPELLQAAQQHQQALLLGKLYVQVGRPSLRQLEQRTGLSKSTVHRVITGQSRAGATETFRALVDLCPPDLGAQWRVAWDAARSDTPSSPKAAATTRLFTRPAGRKEEEAVADLLRAVERVRNLVVHGQVALNPLVAAQVVQLQVAIEATAAPEGSTDGIEMPLTHAGSETALAAPAATGTDAAGAMMWTGESWAEIPPDQGALRFKDDDFDVEPEALNHVRISDTEERA
ncbi:helix-turn-helix domain-containing protein [Streptomyces sp. NPDC058128]|uniref:helix-turn-helix domain-containing protein n=1 Tax=Streptomyces sp. NPDC058128 TaxID=3346352 RepID=UPI0036E2BBF6